MHPSPLFCEEQGTNIDALWRLRSDICSGCRCRGASTRSFCILQRARRWWTSGSYLSTRHHIHRSRIRRYLRRGGRNCWNGGREGVSRQRTCRCAIWRSRPRQDDTRMKTGAKEKHQMTEERELQLKPGLWERLSVRQDYESSRSAQYSLSRFRSVSRRTIRLVGRGSMDGHWRYTWTEGLDKGFYPRRTGRAWRMANRAEMSRDSCSLLRLYLYILPLSPFSVIDVPF